MGFGSFVNSVMPSPVRKVASTPVGGALVGGAIGGPMGSFLGYQYGQSQQDQKNAFQLPTIDPNQPFGMARPQFATPFTQRLSELAMAQGPSQATRFATGQAIQAAESGTQSALSNLAMRGGLTGGARERILGLGAGQRATAQTEAFGRGLGMDEMNRLNLMQNLDQQQRQFSMQDFIARLGAASGQSLAGAQLALANQKQGGFLSNLPLLGSLF